MAVTHFEILDLPIKTCSEPEQTIQKLVKEKSDHWSKALLMAILLVPSEALMRVSNARH